jgi:hypothetical protein
MIQTRLFLLTNILVFLLNGTESQRTYTIQDFATMKDLISKITLVDFYNNELKVLHQLNRWVLPLGSLAMVYSALNHPEGQLLPLAIATLYKKNQELEFHFKLYEKIVMMKSAQLQNFKNLWKRINPEEQYTDPINIRFYICSQDWLNENKQYLNPILEKHFQSTSFEN